MGNFVIGFRQSLARGLRRLADWIDVPEEHRAEVW